MNKRREWYLLIGKKGITDQEIPGKGKYKSPEAGRRVSNEVRVAGVIWRGNWPEGRMGAKSQSVLEHGKEFGYFLNCNIVIYNIVLISVYSKMVQLCVNIFVGYFPLKVIKNIEHSSMYYTINPCCLFIIYTVVVCIC